MASRGTALALVGLFAATSAPVAAQTGFGGMMDAPVPELLLAQSTCVSMGLNANLMSPYQIIDEVAFDHTNGVIALSTRSRVSPNGPALTAVLIQRTPEMFSYSCLFGLEDQSDADIARIWSMIGLQVSANDGLNANGLVSASTLTHEVTLEYCRYAQDYAPGWVAQFTESFVRFEVGNLAYSVDMVLASPEHSSCTPEG